jgi:hypothetical protein
VVKRAWRIKVDARTRRAPDVDLLARAVRALAEQLHHEAEARGPARHQGPDPVGETTAANERSRRGERPSSDEHRGLDEGRQP